MTGYSEAEIVAEAKAILGSSSNADEEILGAGYFGLTNLVAASAIGATAGGLAGAAVGDEWSSAVAALAARHLAVEASAAAQGVTVQLIVAVTADTIHVLNRDTGGQLRSEVVSFARDRVEVSITKVGASRHMTLTDPATGVRIELHGTTGWISPLAKGDKIVFDLLQK